MQPLKQMSAVRSRGRWHAATRMAICVLPLKIMKAFKQAMNVAVLLSLCSD